jgi:hypothetical protein
MVYGILVALLITSFATFGFFLNQLIRDTTSITAVADSVYVDDSSIGIETDSEGTSFNGSIAFFESTIPYDTIYDDDTTGDGYRDRRSYYLGDQLVFASWDENADWIYETSMKIVDGMYVESQISDMDNNGVIDTITTFSNDGEELFTETDLINYEDAGYRENPYAPDLSAETIFWLVLPLGFGLLFLGILIVLLFKRRKANRIASLLLCLIMIVGSLAEPVYASDLYNDDGSVNQEVFEKDWEKYSDIDNRIPLEQRSYEAMEYGKAEQEIPKLYSLMYQAAANQELNRLNYIDLVAYKKAVATTHKKNLIKSTIRLAAFTGYTVKDSVGKGKTFATNILKSGSTIVTQIGDVLTVTSDFVTDSYKESFGTLQKVYQYGTSDDIVKEIFDDMKKDVKDQVSIKIDETIDEAIGRKRIPDYTVDDLKISDDDVQLLKSHYDKSRELDNAILQNRKTNTKYDKKINDIVWKILLEMNKLDEFRQAEKDRVFYILSQNPPENTNQDEEESIGLLGQTTSGEGENGEDGGFFSGDYSDEVDISWLDDVEIIDEDASGDITNDVDGFSEEPFVEEYNTDQLVGVWSGTTTVIDFDITTNEVITDEVRAEIDQLIGQSFDVSINIYKEGDIYLFKYGELLMKIEQNGNNIRIERGYIEGNENGSALTITADLVGHVNDLNNEMTLDTVFQLNGTSEAKFAYIDLIVRMVIVKK